MNIPKYFDHNDKCLRFLEWKALEKFSGTPSHQQYPEFSQRWASWADHFTSNQTAWQKDLYSRCMRGEFNSIEDFYSTLNARINGRKPKALAAQERKVQSQRDYQKEKLGDAFVDNDALISAVKAKAKELAETRSPGEQFFDEVLALSSEHSESPLSNAQVKVLSDLISNEILKYQALDRAEASLIDLDDKNAWFLWGKIKRNHHKESKFTLSSRQIAEYASVSKDKGASLIKKLVKVGVIRELSKAKQSTKKRKAGIYQRCV